ncbi:g6817 [Coccomyxa viridis]|uniref:G6817 protein n=1 Tax=Coccomyxa viridis TaxID=1274662 RepID=A0ABP1G2Z0_9CHLO
MDDTQLAEYYDKTKAKGAGAHYAKAGLGFATPGMAPQGRGLRPPSMDGNGQSSVAVSRPPLYADGTGTAAGASPSGPPQSLNTQGNPGQQPPVQIPPGPHPPFGARLPQGMQPPPGMPQHGHRPPFPPGMPQHFPGGPPPRMPGMPPMHMGPPPGYMPYGMPHQYGMHPMGMRPPPGMPPHGMPGPPGGFPGRPGGPPNSPAAQRPPGLRGSQPQQLPGPPRPVQHVGLPAAAAAPSSQPAAAPAEPASAAPWHVPLGPASADPAASVRAAIAAESKAEEEKAQKAKEASAWIAHKAADGQVYYYNTLTNESSWEKPKDYAGDVSKASAQLTPVSTQPVKGTDWSEVVCADGRKYYFNGSTQETSWTAPPEVKAVLGKKAQLPGSTTGISSAAAAHLARAQDIQTAAGNDHDASFSLEDIQPAKSRAAPPKKAPSIQKSIQELTQEFKDLLSEKGVTPFSRWEKELPKLITDPRYTAVGSLKERRLIFDDFCKTSADEHKRSKADRARKSREDFQVLLEEAAKAGTAEKDDEGKSFPSITAETTIGDLAEHWGSDPRWQACDEKLRAELLEAVAAPLRLAKAKAEKESETKKKAQETSYRELLKENKVAAGARWSKTKDSLAGDKRYKALARDQRERIFRQYVAEQEEAERAAAKERKERGEREREAHKKLARDTEEAEGRRRKAAAADAAANYRTLLSEWVKDPEASWADWRVRLAKDPQGRFNHEALDRRQAEAIFREHLGSLQKRIVDGYVALLEEVIRPLLPSQKPEGDEPDGPSALRRFPEAEKLLQEDPRFAKTPPQDREKFWRHFVEDIRLERDDPAAASRRGRVSLAGRTNKGRVQLKDDAGAVTDKAYEREYLAHDRKRIRRD